MTELKPKYNKDGERVSSGRVVRRTVSSTDHRGRRIVVALEPGDIIAFRKERTRTWWRISIEGAYQYAVKLAVDAKRAKKKAEKKARKQ